APTYGESFAHASSYIIDMRDELRVRKIQAMSYPRTYVNTVPLPNGQVVVIGGATFAMRFTDAYAVMVPELFDPQTEAFVTLPPMNVPRAYHSFALLLHDGRVLAGGGGLCGGCASNHPD